jgi:hypothetical protein
LSSTMAKKTVPVVCDGDVEMIDAAADVGDD